MLGLYVRCFRKLGAFYPNQALESGHQGKEKFPKCVQDDFGD